MVNAATVTTTGIGSTGVYALSNTGDATVTAVKVTTTGNGAAGIRSLAAVGTASVNATNVSTAGADAPAIYAAGANAVVVSTGTVSASGTPVDTTGDAITALATVGDATATVNNVSATGGTATQRALVVTTPGVATANITGAVTAPAADQVVVLTGDTTVATLSATGSIVGATNALYLNGTNGSSLTNAGTITGGATGSAVTSTTGPLTVTNYGTIGSGSNLALLVLGGPATIGNSGTINGHVTLTAGDDVVNNSGVFNAPVNSDFGAGTDVFNNSGTLNVLPTATVPGSVTFTGLETFNNSGTVSLVNGHTGDTLTIPGNFVGTANSRLAVDIQPGAIQNADVLVVQGAATGSTAVVLNNINSGNAGVTNGTYVVATGGAGTSATAFGVSAQSQNIGFVNYGITTSTAAGVTSFALVGTPGDTVFRMVKINEGAQNLWYKSADAWALHTADLRDAKWGTGPDNAVGGGRVWGIMYGGAQKREATQSGTAFGVSRTADTSYKQDAFGGQIGMDLGGISGESAVVFGVTGGYVSSDLTFQNSADRTSYNVVNGGVYASFVSGSVFANALAKYDHYWIDTRSPVASFRSKYNGESYGAQGELGFRFGSDTFYAEPVISGSYVRTDLDSPSVTNATIDFDKLDGVRGKAGLRIGSAIDLGSSRAVVYLSGNAVHEFKGRQGLSFTSGGTAFNYRNDRIGTYGEGKIGFNITSPGGVTGFVEGFGNYSNEYKGGGARAGLRSKL